MSTSLSSAGVASKLRRGDYLRPIALHIRDALLGRSKTKAPCSEALHCAGTLAVALGRDWQPYIPLLLEPMFQTGLSGGWGGWVGWVGGGCEGGGGVGWGGPHAKKKQLVGVGLRGCRNYQGGWGGVDVLRRAGRPKSSPD